MSGRRGPTMRRRCGRRVSRAREATVFDDIGAPLLDVSAAGVREAAAAEPSGRS